MEAQAHNYRQQYAIFGMGTAGVEHCHRIDYPNKRGGSCVYTNTYGKHGCDEQRTPYCQQGEAGDKCTCSRCTEGNGCYSWESGSSTSQARICATCKFSNTYGVHGCPVCLD